MSFRRPAAIVAAASVALACMTTAALAAGQPVVARPDLGAPIDSGATTVVVTDPGTTLPPDTVPPNTAPPTTAPPTTAPPTTAPPTTAPPTTAPPTTVPAPKGIVMARDSVTAAGWFHVTGVTVPAGTKIIRYRNVGRLLQTGLAYHGAGSLSFWFRAPGAPGSSITVQLDALDGYLRPIKTLGTITLRTGNAMLPLPKNSGTGRRVVIQSDQQQVWLVESDGRVSDTFLMSGRRIRTASGYDQPGVFRVYSKSLTMHYCEGTCGTANYMVRYQRTTSSVGTHSLPVEHGKVVQGVQDLGWPLSHGCTRLDPAKAKALYRWAPYGTIVIVL